MDKYAGRRFYIIRRTDLGIYNAIFYTHIISILSELSHNFSGRGGGAAPP